LTALLSYGAAAAANRWDTLTIKVVDSDGHSVAHANVSIKASSSHGETGAAGTITLTGVAKGSHVIRVTKIGSCPVDRKLRVHGDTDVTITVKGCSDALSTGIDGNIIAFADLKSTHSGTPECVNDVVVQGGTAADLHRNALALTEGGLSCHGSAGVLSKDHGFWFTNDAALLPWTDALGDVMNVSLTARLAVPMKIFVSDVALSSNSLLAPIRTTIREHLANAEAKLVEQYTGLRIAGTGGASDPVIENLKQTNASLIPVVGSGCESAQKIARNPALYDQGRLNVFYAAGLDGTAAGWTCEHKGYPNIIFIADVGAHPYTLLHEVGHALGLIRPAWGHTGGLAGFRTDKKGNPLNLMAETSLDGVYLSVGQVAQMHLSASSWLNFPSASDHSTVRSRASSNAVVDACSCPESGSTPDCPAISLDLPKRPGTWLTTTSVSVTACTVVVTPNPITISCGRSIPVTATYSRTGEEVKSLDAKWASFTPTVATVSSTETSGPVLPASHPTRGAIIQALAAGSATVRAWADGAFTDITVNVTCP